MPLAVLARLADVVGLPPGRLVHRWHDDDPDDAEDRSMVGAYLAEFKEGLSRDDLAEALDWTLVRVERALAALDTGLRRVGMRLALRAERIVVVGRLDRTDLSSRLSLERLTAGELDPVLASFLWDALVGIAPERIRDRETFDSADRLGSCGYGTAGSASASRLSTPCTRQRTGTAARLATDKLLAHPLTRPLRTH